MTDDERKQKFEDDLNSLTTPEAYARARELGYVGCISEYKDALRQAIIRSSIEGPPVSRKAES